MIYAAYAKKKKKNEPWYDSKGNLVDSGENVDIMLNRSTDKNRLEMFMKNIEKNVNKDDWTFWIEEYKD